MGGQGSGAESSVSLCSAFPVPGLPCDGEGRLEIVGVREGPTPGLKKNN